MTGHLMRPDRRQYQRRAGWRMPDNSRYVGRGRGEWGKYGNPFPVVTPGWGGRFVAVVEFRINLWWREHDLPHRLPPDYPSMQTIRAELAGKTLLCWCDEHGPCHGEPLWYVANGFTVYGQRDRRHPV